MISSTDLRRVRQRYRAPNIADPWCRSLAPNPSGWVFTPGPSTVAYGAGGIHFGGGGSTIGGVATYRLDLTPGRSYAINAIASRSGTVVAGAVLRVDLRRVSDGQIVATKTITVPTTPNFAGVVVGPIVADGPVDIVATDVSTGNMATSDVTLRLVDVIVDPAPVQLVDPSLFTIAGWTTTGTPAPQFGYSSLRQVGFGVGSANVGTAISQSVPAAAGTTFRVVWAARRYNGPNPWQAWNVSLRLRLTSNTTAAVLYDDTIQVGNKGRPNGAGLICCDEEHASAPITVDGAFTVNVTDTSTTSTAGIDVCLSRLSFLAVGA